MLMVGVDFIVPEVRLKWKFGSWNWKETRNAHAVTGLHNTFLPYFHVSSILMLIRALHLLSINKLSTSGFGKLLPRYLSMAPLQVTQWMTKNYPRPRVDPV
jgi:hypothetical protein